MLPFAIDDDLTVPAIEMLPDAIAFFPPRVDIDIEGTVVMLVPLRMFLVPSAFDL